MSLPVYVGFGTLFAFCACILIINYVRLHSSVVRASAVKSGGRGFEPWQRWTCACHVEILSLDETSHPAALSGIGLFIRTGVANRLGKAADSQLFEITNHVSQIQKKCLDITEHFSLFTMYKNRIENKNEIRKTIYAKQNKVSNAYLCLRI